MGRGRPKRVIPITNPSKEPTSTTNTDRKEKSRGTEDRQSPQSSMEQLKSLSEMWPPLHGSISARSLSIDNGEQSHTLTTSMRNPIAEKTDADKENQMKVTKQLGTNKPITEQEAQIHRKL
ncbi:hypothetical protein A4A49_60077, partial [Nicotiana attenuata]